MLTITDPSTETVPLLGDFGLVGKHPGSWLDHAAQDLISFGTDSPFVHAFVYVGNGQIVEAVRHVKVSPVTAYHDITWSTGRLAPELTPNQAQRMVIAKAAMSYVGQAYNLLDILAIALAQPRLGRQVDGDEWWVKRLSDDHMQICSQLVVNAYRMAGVDLVPGTLSGLVSPGDLGGLLRVS
jgi:uncharacterized protein YycO